MDNKRSRNAYATPTNKQNRKRSQLDYQRYEQRNLLAADFIGQLGNDALLIDELAARRDTAWMQQGLNQLVEVGSDSNKAGTVTVFQQSWNGLPVHDSWVTVVQDVDGNITNVRDQAKQNIDGYATDADPIDAKHAMKIASTGLGNSNSLKSNANLAWYYAGNKARLSWLVESTVSDAKGETTGEYETWVNVFDGQIFDRDVQASAVTALLADSTTETGVFPRIVINNTIGATGSRTYAAPFDAVVSISVGCTGTLISPNTVISARHCGIGGGATVRFGDNSNSPDATFSVSSASQPAGSGSLLDGGDVSILTLSSSVPASIATPMRFIDATNDLVGMTAATIGYGYNGVGSTGHGFSADGRRWGGENVIDAYGSPAATSGSNIISTDFDDGTSGSNTIGTSSATPLQFEATTAPGDSGGPVLVDVGGEWVIAGVLSGGTTNTSVYGDISWWTGTAVYRSQIESAGGIFVGDGAGSVSFSQDSFFVGDSVGLQVRDGNAVGDVSVTITSDSGDSETLTVSPTSAGSYNFTINSAAGTVAQNDGSLQVAEGDEITVTYIDADDGDGNMVNQTDTAAIVAIAPPALIGIDFDDAPNAPLNWLANSGASGSFDDLDNEDGGASQIDLTINGSPLGYDVPLNASTIPQHTNSITNVNGQIYTGANSIELVYSDLEPSQDYHVYIMSAEGFFNSIEQTVTIQGAGSPVSFEQRFNQGDLFVNDQLGDSSRDLSEYAQVITADSNGVITINVDPISGTDDVVLAGLAIFEAPVAPAAPEITLNGNDIHRSMVNETVLTFDEVVTIGTDAFELVQRGPNGGPVDVAHSTDNSNGYSIVTLSFSGAFVETSGSLSDGNYQLTIVGDQITSSSGVAVDGDGDGLAGGNLVFGDTETDNFFRFFGDGNGDRNVNVFDLLQFRQTYNESTGSTAYDQQFDFNLDGNVNVFDLLSFRQNYLEQLDFV